tara:strand:+ start:954 stop:2771 length:1818 start_codon:yes stop_codon:yes gene_type:complete
MNEEEKKVKYTKPIPLDKLPETPAIYGEMLDEFEQTKRTVERETEVEGLGKGKLVMSQQNDYKPFFYADEANYDANIKAAKQLSVAENIVNLPATVAPLLGIARGARRLINQKSLNRAKRTYMKVDESLEQADRLKNSKPVTDAVGNITPTKNFLANLKQRITTDIDRSGLTMPFKIMRGQLILDTTAGGNRPENPIDKARYYELNNPDSYVVDQFDPNYGKLKSEITFVPTSQQQLNIKQIDPITIRSMMKRGIDNNVLANGRLDYEKLLTSNTFVPGYRRFIAADWATVPEKGLPLSKVKRTTTYQNRITSFNNYRKELLAEFKQIFGPDISRLGFPESQLDLDHRLTLVQSLGLLQNTAPGDPMWTQLTEYGLRRGYTAGDAKANLDLIDPETHRVKTNFFNDLHGLSLKGKQRNMKYWGGLHRKTGKTRNQIMKESHLGPEQAALHMEVAKDYFDVVDRGDKILKDAQAVFMASNKLGILPDEIVESLMPVVLDTKYSPKQVQKAIQDIVKRNTQNYKALEKRIDLLEFIEDYENFPNSPLSAEQYGEIDPADVADAKKEFKKLGRVTDRKSYIQRELDRRARIKHKEKLSGFIQGDLFDE